jgi:N-carbamoylputrescine amidase
MGRVIAQATDDREEILYADCDLRALEDARRGWPFLRDRRIDAYDGLLARWLDDPHAGSGEGADAR